LPRSPFVDVVNLVDGDALNKPFPNVDSDLFTLANEVIGSQTVRQILARKVDVPCELRHPRKSSWAARASQPIGPPRSLIVRGIGDPAAFAPTRYGVKA
jgi:hypothetical protein